MIPDPQNPDHAAAKHILKGYSPTITFEANQSGIQIMEEYPRAILKAMNVRRSGLDDLINPSE